MPGVINSNQQVRAYSLLIFCYVGLRHFLSHRKSESHWSSLLSPTLHLLTLYFVFIRTGRTHLASSRQLHVRVCTLTPRPATYAANCTCAAGRREPQFVPAGPHTDGPRGSAPFPLSFPLSHTSARFSVPQENNTPLNPFHPENKQRSASNYH